MNKDLIFVKYFDQLVVVNSYGKMVMIFCNAPQFNDYRFKNSSIYTLGRATY